ncbi:growth arrest-specific protein 1 [Lampris incognitus]|uniref:growth arrest-specific protein 1 n=1 Tax=Lampris incognitus TaxID=2546036 RepID=UPI0024B63452|nr:growth arrest-specific protein 1 [Lampris incognitus]
MFPIPSALLCTTKILCSFGPEPSRLSDLPHASTSRVEKVRIAELRLHPSMKCWFSALALVSWLLVAVDAQLICWHALLRCHDEPECELAYSQYLAACEGIIGGTRKQCPSHCINALIRLNHTRSGPDLETCDCAQDLKCVNAKRAIEPCVPRRHPGDAGGIGCTEARQRCEEDSGCHSSLTAYLSYCGQLFNGRKCSAKCKATIQQMLFIPNGVLLNRCVCDGVERPFCEVVKENMSKLCSIGDQSVISDQPDVDYIYEDEDYDRSDREEAYPDDFSGSWQLSCYVPLLCLPLAWILY